MRAQGDDTPDNVLTIGNIGDLPAAQHLLVTSIVEDVGHQRFVPHQIAELQRRARRRVSRISTLNRRSFSFSTRLAGPIGAKPGQPSTSLFSPPPSASPRRELS